MVDSLIENSDILSERLNALFDSSSPPLTPIQMEEHLKGIFRNKLRFFDGIPLAKEPLKWCTNENEFVAHLLSLIKHEGFNTTREIALVFFAYCTFALKLIARICVAFTPMPRMLNGPARNGKKTAANDPRPDLLDKTTATKRSSKNGISGKRKKKKSDKETNKESDNADETDSEEEIGSKKKATKKMERSNAAQNEVNFERKGELLEENPRIRETYWNEYWDEVDRRWICVDSFHNSVDRPRQIQYKLGSTNKEQSFLYVLAVDNEGGVREIGAKYVENYLHLATRKLRADRLWINETLELKPIRANECRMRLEDAEIHQYLMSKPLPTTMSEYKNHLLYALKKDLLKFEAIYPSDTPSIGHIGKQKYEIYPRSSVHKLEGSLNWIKESRSIKTGERPYKVVAARPKLNIPKEKREPLMLDLFGYWQTEPYVPPDVTPDGRIPRNEFGNIYMYKEDMLPKNCVHLRLSGIYNLARRLDLEAVPAVVGWEFSGGFNHPILDGCVVLRKDEEVLRSAWQQMAREKAAKEAKRAADRVWKNWRRLIRGKVLLEQMRERFITKGGQRSSKTAQNNKL